MKAFFVRLLLLILLLVVPLASRAQTSTAQILGQITDSSGAAIAGAAVTVTNVDTNLSRKSVTNETGNYTVNLLPPGNYMLVVEKTGFAPLTENHLVLRVDQNLTVNVPMAIGNTSETVTVEGSSELLQASSSELGTVIDQKAVHDLPLNGRNFTQLLTLTPGATPVSTSQGANLGTDDGSTVSLPGSAFSNPSVNGQQNRSTLYLFDGIANTDFRTTTYTVLPIIDAIDQFKVVSHVDDPQYGSVLGGIVNLVSNLAQILSTVRHGSLSAMMSSMPETPSLKSIELPRFLSGRTNLAVPSAAPFAFPRFMTGAIKPFSSSVTRDGGSASRQGLRTTVPRLQN